MNPDNYAQTFMEYVKFSAGIMVNLDNHGYFREFVGDSVVFFPKNPADKYHSIGMTPGLNQPMAVIEKDVARGRILLVGEACNSSGDYVILEDDTGYLTLTGNLSTDLVAYCDRVIKAISNVVGRAEWLKMSPHDYVAKIAD